ncbi:MAG: hypothetical protein IJ849_11020 [Selenomonadaceae bacterium]|nr:hypothetical protein [Selenomonadaceae bacterium]
MLLTPEQFREFEECYDGLARLVIDEAEGLTMRQRLRYAAILKLSLKVLKDPSYVDELTIEEKVEEIAAHAAVLEAKLAEQDAFIDEISASLPCNPPYNPEGLSPDKVKFIENVNAIALTDKPDTPAD